MQGVKYGFVLWLVINLWDISHPLIYGSFDNKNQLFWLLYYLSGFLALGATAGFFYRKQSTPALEGE